MAAEGRDGVGDMADGGEEGAPSKCEGVSMMVGEGDCATKGSDSGSAE